MLLIENAKMLLCRETNDQEKAYNKKYHMALYLVFLRDSYCDTITLYQRTLKNYSSKKRQQVMTVFNA
jgi:hypothetical protein